MTSVLAINAGSSSLRLAAYRRDGPTLLRTAVANEPAPPQPDAAPIRAFMERHGLPPVERVVHRVVHGGARFDRAVRIDADVEAEIERLCPLAPLHNPVALAWIRAARAILPRGAAEVATFDTAFYADLPEIAASYALPPELCRRHGIRRYGFHGLAHRSMLDQWVRSGGDPDARVISLQLGSGCSVTASRSGRPLDTSMGFSPLEGLVMATRSGDLDPAVVLHLLAHDAFTPASLLELLNERSGLLGVSGTSRDMKDLLQQSTPDAALAVDLFCARARKYIGAYLAVLGGADAILVGGGIGEHSPEIRDRVFAQFEWAGISIDRAANRTLSSGGGPIHDGSGPVAVRVIEVDEMHIMAHAALDA